MKHVLGLALAAVMMAAPVSAAVVDVVITGVVSDSGGSAYDDLNLFGGNLLGGAAFSALFTYDTLSGTRSGLVNSFPADLLQGSVVDMAGLPVKGSLTVGGVTHVMKSDPSLSELFDNGSVFVQPNFSPGDINDFNWAGYSVAAEAYSADFQQTAAGNLSFQLQTALGSLPTSLETSYTFNADPAVYGQTGQFPTMYGTWVFSTFDRDTNIGVASFAQLFGETLTVTVRDPGIDPVPSPVPLPATAPLLLAGLAAFAALRAKRRASDRA